MPSSAVTLGPFVGGLNKSSDASAIADNELSECVNLNVDLDGSLVCRPPISEVDLDFQAIEGLPALTGRILIIGCVTLNNVTYLMASTEQAGVYAIKFDSTLDGKDHFTAILIHTTLKSDCAIQLHNVVFILARPDSPVNSVVWDGVSSISGVYDDAAPRGSAALFFKGRVFVAPGASSDFSLAKSSQLVFSDPVPLTLPITIPWNPVNLIPVGQGDGENLIDLLVVADNLMLFKNNSTYAYLYDVSPNDGILRKINNDIGVSAQFCALTHGNEAYVYHEGTLYQIANYTFVETNLKLPFKRSLVEDTRREKVVISLLGDFILVRYFDSLYALNLVTKTWSEWQSANAGLNSLGRIVKYETNSVSSKFEGYYGGSCIPSNTFLMRIKESHTLEDYEFYLEDGVATAVDIECTMISKVFDFGTPHLFKRLMWWGVDLISKGDIYAVANPVRQIPEDVTWEALAAYNWNQLFTWENPLVNTEFVVTNVTDLFVLRRKFMKLLKSLRFRQISFIIKFWSNGQIAPEQTLGPARVFSISAIVGAKQTVVKQVS